MRGRNLALVVATVLFVASLPVASQFSLDWQLDRMFPPGDPLVASYHRLQERFGGNEVVLAVYRDPNVWSPDGQGLDRLAQVSDRLAQVEGVQAVLSLAELHRLLQALRGPFEMLSPQGKLPPLLDQEDTFAQSFAAVFAGYTHIPGSQTVAVACMLEPLTDQRRNHRETITRIRHVLSELPAPLEDGLVTGEPVMVTDGFDMVERDGWRLGVVSTLLLAFVLLIVFRSVRWALIPLCVVHWSIVVTQAILAIARLELTMVSSMLTAIITVVGVATTMHILLAYQQMRAAKIDCDEAMRRTMSEMRAPVFWACVTDAVGFISLAAAEVGPVRDFGVMMAIGSLVVLLAIFLLVPGLALVGSWDRDPHVPPFDFTLRVVLRKLLFEILERRRLWLGILMILAILGVWGSLLMRVETDFTKNFRESSALVEGYRAVESELGGAGVWDVMLPAPKVITEDYMKTVQHLEDELRGIFTSPDGYTELRLTKVLSIADANAAAQVNPLLAKLPVTARIEGMRGAMPIFTNALLTPNADADGVRWLRIMLRSREQSTAEAKNRLVELVTHKVAEFTHGPEWLAHFNTSPPKAEVTGTMSCSVAWSVTCSTISGNVFCWQRSASCV